MDLLKKFNQNQLYILPLQADDGDAVQDIFENDATYFLKHFGFPPGAEAQSLFSAIPEGKDYQDKFLFGLKNDSGLLLGFAELICNYPQYKEWCIATIFIRKDYRGCGLGRYLHTYLWSFVSSREAVDLVARIGVLNTNAIGFFLRCGYIIEELKWEANSYRCAYMFRNALRSTSRSPEN